MLWVLAIVMNVNFLLLRSMIFKNTYDIKKMKNMKDVYNQMNFAVEGKERKRIKCQIPK